MSEWKPANRDSDESSSEDEKYKKKIDVVKKSSSKQVEDSIGDSSSISNN
jgi:hypothetical protein